MPPTIILPPETPYSDVEKSYISEQPANLFPTNQDSIFGTHRKVFCDEMEKIVEQIQLLYNERFPDTTLQYLTNWEEDLGLPVNSPAQSIQQRQQAVRARIKRGRFTRTLRRETVEGYILATFGEPARFSTTGIPITVPGIPLHSGIEGIDPTPYYTITETITNYYYQVLIDSIIDIDLPALDRELKRITPAGIQYLLGKAYKRSGGGKSAGTFSGAVVGIRLRFGGGVSPAIGGGTRATAHARTGGAKISNSNIATDSFSRIAVNGWGALENGEPWVRVFGATSAFSVNGSEALINADVSGNTYENKIGNALNWKNQEALVRVKFASIPGGALGLMKAGISTRSGTTRHWEAMLQYDTTVNKYTFRVNYYAQEFAYVMGGAFPPINAWWWIKIRAENNVLRAKTWADGTSEPGTWTSTVNFTGPSIGAGYTSLKGLVSGTTFPTISFDDFSLTTFGNSGFISAANRNSGAISSGFSGGAKALTLVRTGGATSGLVSSVSRIVRHSRTGGASTINLGGGTHS